MDYWLKNFLILIFTGYMMLLEAEQLQLSSEKKSSDITVNINILGGSTNSNAASKKKPKKDPVKEYIQKNRCRCKDGKEFIKFYVSTWSKHPFNYKALYRLLHDEAKEEMSEDKFISLCKDRDKPTGGPAKVVELKKISGNDFSQEWRMKILYKRLSAKPVILKATIEKQGEYFYVKEGGLIPLDLDSF